MQSPITTAQQRDFLGIVFVGAGSAWAQGTSEMDAATRAAKQARKDWGAIYDFGKCHTFNVMVYDITDSEGWYADARGLYDDKTNKRMPFIDRYLVIA